MSRDWTDLTWREKTVWERTQTVFARALAGLAGLAMFVGILFILGQIIDTQEAYRMERHHCLKNATNGLEIDRCR